MKILSLLGSPRKKGNTAYALNYLEEQLKQMNHEIKHIHVPSLSIEGCRECFWCKRAGSFLCSNKDDDGMSVLKDMIKSDGIIFSAPVFWWGFPAQMKALIDRMYCLLPPEEKENEYTSLMGGKTTALIVTAGSGIKNNADILGLAYKNTVEFTGCKSAGIVYIAPCSGVESIDDKVKQQLTQLAQNFK